MPSVQSFDFLLFGGTGDLALRKLLPALYYCHSRGEFPSHGRIVGLARNHLSRDEYIQKVKEHCAKFVAKEDFNEQIFQSFTERLYYLPIDANLPQDYEQLATYLNNSPAEVRVFYLSTSPDLFASICINLAKANVVNAESRVVLEKPLGRDYASAEIINEAVGSVFREPQIYRIDHYLGKEPVQNLLALRFGNALFEPLWSRASIHDVQITIAEQLGAEGRGDFYDRIGALRDVLQNHLLQLLCIIAMEPPSSIDPSAVRNEKLKVLRSLSPIDAKNISTCSVRGQYRAGAINGVALPGYLDEPGVSRDSRTETYVALRTEINNWRWADVPFFLRTGKRLQERVAEIVVNFRPVPHAIFPIANTGMQGNQLVIQLQPEEELKLYLMAKEPGDTMTLTAAYLNLDFSEQFKTRPMDAYERLLLDVLRGNLTLFMRRDELEEAWRWIEPILEAWEATDEKPKPYTSGSWGPPAASALVAREGTAWREEIS